MLPTGGTLPPEAFATRHAAVVWLLAAHVVGLPAFGLLRGYGLLHVLLDVGPVALCAMGAVVPGLSQRARATVAALGLVTCSAVLTHLWGGVTEAHFHFFVVMALLSLYEDWAPWGLAFVFVLVHHGIVGKLQPGSVYGDHAAAVAHPWTWALVHAAFIAAMAMVNLVSWRSSEVARGWAGGHEARFRSAFDEAPRGMAIVDADGTTLEANAALLAATGHAADDLLGRPLAVVCPPGEEGPSGERRLRRADGSTGWALWKESALTRSGQRVVHLVDISARREAETALAWRAHHDPLTGLPNRRAFLDLVDAALERRTGAGGDPDHVGVLFVDLDDFKVINDSLGHGAGDRWLKAVAERLTGSLRPGDVVARFGGDEFTVLLTGVSGERHARRIADRLAASLRAPIVLDGITRFVSASVGLALAGGAGPVGAESLLEDADAAMYHAKELGKGRCELYDESMRVRARERLELEGAVREALWRGELTLAYQPQVALSDQRMVGVEALLRWHHPRLGQVSPATFIPIAERTGAILEIGAWVLREACEQAVGWSSDLEVSVNVSALQLVDAGFAPGVRAVLAETGLAPARLCLEVTETALLRDVAAARAALTGLRALGVRVAIDDFGVGHASLRHLRELLPVDVIKVDKSFIDGLTRADGSAAIVAAVIGLAHALGVVCVAEGVEEARQAYALWGMECDLVQGFQFGRPVCAAEIAAWAEGARV